MVSEIVDGKEQGQTLQPMFPLPMDVCSFTDDTRAFVPFYGKLSFEMPAFDLEHVFAPGMAAGCFLQPDVRFCCLFALSGLVAGLAFD